MTDTPVAGDDITADLWNAEHQNHINNAIPASIDDYSPDVSTMQSTADPYPASAESLATSTAGEFQRLRYQILEFMKRFGKARAETKWYADLPYAFGIKGTDIASGGVITIPNDGNYYVVTGTSAISGIAALGIGSRVTLVIDGALTLVNSADLVLPGGGDIVAEAGDVFDFVEYAAGDWRCVSSSRGPKVTPWTNFTPTGSWSSNTTYAGKYRRVGDTLEVDVTLSLAGTPTTASLTVNLPSGLTIDTAKLSGPGSEQFLGHGLIADASPTAYIAASVLYGSTTSVAIRYHNIDNSRAELNGVSQSAPVAWANDDKINFRYTVPISGWSVL
jgi:hypothetical protein